MLYAAIAISQHEVVAFAPAMVKGREHNVLRSSAASPELTVAKSSITKSTKSHIAKSKNKDNRKPAKKKGRKRVNVKNAPTSKNNAPTSKKNAPNRKTSKSKNNDNTKLFKPLKDLKLGSTISGTVVDVCDFGAFVNIGYATRGSRAGTALLHISQLSDKKIKNIRDMIKVGDSIEGARVISVDLKKGEAGVSLRKQRPKRRDFTKLKAGDDLEGKVDTVLSYGVFVDVGANVNALLHISRITGGAIENVRQHLNEGDPVSVHVIDIDQEKKTMAVSMLDKKADQYLDRRMSQRLKRFYGTAASKTTAKKADGDELEYFDIAIRELEEALSDREV